jgi:hypothetical protein
LISRYQIPLSDIIGTHAKLRFLATIVNCDTFLFAIKEIQARGKHARRTQCTKGRMSVDVIGLTMRKTRTTLIDRCEVGLWNRVNGISQ